MFFRFLVGNVLRQNGVQFFISPLASWLRTRRFSEPAFRPSGARNHWKNTLFRDFPLLTLLSSDLSLLSASSLLCFSSGRKFDF